MSEWERWGGILRWIQRSVSPGHESGAMGRKGCERALYVPQEVGERWERVVARLGRKVWGCGVASEADRLSEPSRGSNNAFQLRHTHQSMHEGTFHDNYQQQEVYTRQESQEE